MNILEIYQRYNIPQNLQRHMLRVAAVGQYLAEAWLGQIDQQAVRQALLLHDLGNVLKFDLTKGLDLLDPEERDAAYWFAVQAELRERYGTDEHEATFLMAHEITTDKRVLFLLQNMGSDHLEHVVASSDWELKLCTYADFRVSPQGIVSIEERFRDILQRYQGRSHPLADQEATLEKRQRCWQLEKQLQPMLGIDARHLPAELIAERATALGATTI